MCGRARCTLNPQQVAAACGLSPADAASVPTQHMDRYRPSYNVAPGASLPVLALRKDPVAAAAEGSAGAPIVRCMKWGLVPGFTKKSEKPDHYRMFNARSESVKERASFRRLIPNNRCLVAVEGFYEWKKDGSKKQPYYIHFKDHQPLVFAALYDSWENAEGEILHTFTILTTRSSSALQWLHDRMPVILRDNSIDVWLSDSSPKLESILKPYEELDLVWYPVSPTMGKPSFDGIECIKEIQIKSGGEKPISKFFLKKNEDTSHEPEPEPTKSYEEVKQEDIVSTPKEEPDAGYHQEKISKEEKKEAVEPETRGGGIKREHEEMAPDTRSTDKTSDDKPSRPMKKSEKSVKNQGDKQASLFSYFGRA